MARIMFTHRENERKMVADMYDTCEAILKQAKAEIFLSSAGQTDVLGPRFMSMARAAWAPIRNDRR